MKFVSCVRHAHKWRSKAFYTSDLSLLKFLSRSLINSSGPHTVSKDVKKLSFSSIFTHSIILRQNPTFTRYRLQNDTRLPPSRTVRFSAGRERAIYAIVLELTMKEVLDALKTHHISYNQQPALVQNRRVGETKSAGIPVLERYGGSLHCDMGPLGICHVIFRPPKCLDCPV